MSLLFAYGIYADAQADLRLCCRHLALYKADFLMTWHVMILSLHTYMYL